MATNNILDNSESSAAEDFDSFTNEERNVRIFAKQMLQGRLFLGHFQERRFVDPLKAYRDVVVVNESEIQLKNDITIVRKRLKNYYKFNQWIGITEATSVGAPNGSCFWVESNIDTFGHYWFKIKSVSFRKKEILIKLKMIRPMTNFETETNTNESKLNNVSIDEVLENCKNNFKESFIWFLTEVFTPSNMKQVITFIVVLIMTLVTYIIYGIGFLMDFFLKLMREISVFVQASTPVTIAVVNTCGKIIGGLYILIAMLFRRQTNVPVYYNRPAIAMSRQRPAIMYRQNVPRYIDREPLTITEIE